MSKIVALTPAHPSSAQELLGVWVPDEMTERLPAMSLLGLQGEVELRLLFLLLPLLLGVGLLDVRGVCHGWAVCGGQWSPAPALV